MNTDLYLPGHEKRKANEAKAKEVRDLLQLQVIEARALKNRLGADRIGKIITIYRQFHLENKLDMFMSIVGDSLASKTKTNNFVNTIQQIFEQENKYI